MARLRTATLLIIAVLAHATLVRASDDDAAAYPLRPISLIVPFAAGGPTDLVGRTIVPAMTLDLGQPVLIENITGAGGRAAALRAKRAEADGYALVLGHLGTHAATLASTNPGYNPSFDFEPVGKVIAMPVVLMGRKSLPAETLQDLVTLARHTPLRMGHAGYGSVSHTFCTFFSSLAGITPTLVAFNGTGPAMQALRAGDIDILCDQIATAVPQVRSDAVRAYTMTTPERSAALPDVPTSDEAGLPGFVGRSWTGVFAPKGTPAAIVARVNAALGKALDDPSVRDRLQELGGALPEGEDRAPAALRALVARETEKWLRVLHVQRP